jgi:hypothetical protein
LSNLPQIGGEALALKLAYEYFGESYLPSGAASSAARPAGWVVDGESSFIEIAFEFKPGLAKEALVLRIVADRSQLLARVRFAGPAEIEVKECVPSGQEAGGLRGGALAQLDREGHGGGNDHDRQSDGEGWPNSHGMRSGRK